MTCLQIYREQLSLTTFLRIHSNSKEVSYLPWQSKYPNLKSTCQSVKPICHCSFKVLLHSLVTENFTERCLEDAQLEILYELHFLKTSVKSHVTVCQRRATV